MKEHGYIVKQRQGGFLNPPTHPEHFNAVYTGPRSNPSSCLSLTYAANCDWLSDDTRTQAKEILNAWQKPAIDSQEVQRWILQVLGYFQNCYKGEGQEPECWQVGKLRIAKEGNPDDHAGVHLIRSYYPEYQPSEEQFKEAYWAKRLVRND